MRSFSGWAHPLAGHRRLRFSFFADEPRAAASSGCLDWDDLIHSLRPDAGRPVRMTSTPGLVAQLVRARA
jgi:hypothetical protein